MATPPVFSARVWRVLWRFEMWTESTSCDSPGAPGPGPWFSAEFES